MKTKITALFIVILAVFYSCESELDKYYETPGWLKGNAWQVLESSGNYKLFLTAIDSTSKDLKYKDLVQGKGIITVMAPTDDAFQKYLDENGYSSIAAIPKEVLDKLVGFHLLYYSFSKSALENYNPNGSSAINPYPGMYYKFRTKSSDGVVEMIDKTVLDGDVARKVIRKERFLPVYSFNYFGTYGLDAKSNYEYFYPNSTWTGGSGFNVSNASVLEYNIVTDNGYIYSLDQVLEPLETIYNEIGKYSDYDIFRNAYDRFVQFIYDEASSNEYQGNDSLYQQYYSQLVSIASEWTTGSTYPSSLDYQRLGNLSSISYTLFAPNNAAVQAFFNKYWSAYYSNIEQVNFYPMFYFLRNHVVSQMLFPSQIESGYYTTSSGTTIQLDRNAPNFKKACVNGVVYGLSETYNSAYFDKVTELMFCDPKYDYFLNMMVDNYSAMAYFPSDAIQFTLFLPPNDMIIQNTTLEGKMIAYSNTNPRKFGEQSMLIETDDGLGDMSTSQKTTITNAHIGIELLSQRGDESVYRTLESYNYIYKKGDKVYSSALYNPAEASGSDGVPTAVKYPKTWSNGEVYELTGASASALVPEYKQFKNVISTPDTPTEWRYFKSLISAAGLAVATPPFPFLQGERYIVLIPTDAVIQAGLVSGDIPRSPASEIENFLKSYFIKVSDSNLLDYPFSGTGISAELVTFGKDSAGKSVKFKLSDDGTNLYVEDVQGNKVKITTYFPRMYADCAVYMIEDLLKVE